MQHDLVAVFLRRTLKAKGLVGEFYERIGGQLLDPHIADAGLAFRVSLPRPKELVTLDIQGLGNECSVVFGQSSLEDEGVVNKEVVEESSSWAALTVARSSGADAAR